MSDMFDHELDAWEDYDNQRDYGDEDNRRIYSDKRIGSSRVSAYQKDVANSKANTYFRACIGNSKVTKSDDEFTKDPNWYHRWEYYVSIKAETEKAYLFVFKDNSEFWLAKSLIKELSTEVATGKCKMLVHAKTFHIARDNK